MSAPKIRVTPKVRELLVELDQALNVFNAQTEVLADRTGDVPQSTLLNVGADREHQKIVILGLVWRINKASKGIETQ